jgi:hypothetical protein
MTSRWQRDRPVMLALRDQWTAQLSGEFPGVRLLIEINPDPEPGPTITWNWWITVEVDDFEFDGMMSDDLTVVSFEDEQGRFEDNVLQDKVLDYLRRRIAARL